MVIGIIILVVAVAVIAFGGDKGFDTVDDLGGVVDTSTTPSVQSIATAIATAEGFYVAGSRPARNHNPGDMTQDLIGKSTGKDGAFVTYDTDVDGFENLYAQVNAWLSGTSKHASSSSTITDISSFYTTDFPPGAQASWASTVANQLGVDPSTQLGDING